MPSKKISELPLASGLTGLEQTPIVSNGINKRVTLNDIKALVTKASLDLELVDNTTDLNKPISSATAAALSGKAPLGHSHAISDVTDLTATLASKANSLHSHVVSDVTGLQTALDSKASVNHIHGILDIPNLQAVLDTKTAIGHIHQLTDVSGLTTSLAGKASTTDLNNLTVVVAGKAAVNHNHLVSDVTGLQTALDTKASTADVTALADVVSAKALAVDLNNLQTLVASKAWTNHTHVITDTVGLQTALDSKADVGHTHVIANVAGLQTALDSKASASHTHVIADTAGLQTALDSKAAVDHTHVIANVAGLQTTIDSINTAVSSKQPLLTAGSNITIFNNVISSTGSGGPSLDIIVKPVITYPRNNDINIVESSFLTAPYRNLYGYECVVVRWQIDSTAAFTSANEFILDGNSPSLIVNSVPPIDQYVRVQYEDITGNVSAWSDTVKYTGAPYVSESMVTDFRLKSASIKQTGFSTSISDDGLIAVVGSPAESLEWVGESGPETLTSAGTISIYNKVNGVWALEAKINLPDPATGDRFGHSVSLTSDGQALVVSAPYKTGAAGPDSGIVYVYRRTVVGTVGTWTQASVVENAGSVVADFFGLEVLFKPNGDTIFVSGGSNEEASYVSVLAMLGDGTWFELQKIFHNEEIKPLGFGRSMAISKDGNTLAVGSRHTDLPAGTVYWEPGLTSIGSVTTSENGMYMGVAVYKSEYGYGSSYILDAIIYPPYANGNNGSYTDTAFGWDLSLSDNGSVLAVGDPKLSTSSANDGAVLFYKTSNLAIDIYTKYVLTSTLNNPLPLPQNQFFGKKISLEFNGQRLYVGNPSATLTSSGIYAFENIFSEWKQVMSGLLSSVQVDNSSNILFGSEFSISRDENSIIIASPNQADEEFFICTISALCLFNPIHPHVFLSPETGFRFDGEFGKVLSISSDGRTLAVGYANAIGTGFSNNLENLSYESAGAVYMFEKSLVDDRWFKCKVTTTPGSLAVQSSNPNYNVITEYEHHTSDNFGKSIALSGDGKTLAVTSKSSGLLYIYSKESGGWSKTKVFDTPLTLANFGKAVCVTEDGCTIAVSCSRKDVDVNGNLVNMPKIAFFKKQNNVWSFAEISGPDEECLYMDEVLFTLSPTGKTLAICYPVMSNYGEAVQKLVIYIKTGSTYKLCSFTTTEIVTSLNITSGSISSLNFSHNGELLAVGNALSNEGYGSVSLYNYEGVTPYTYTWKLQTVLTSGIWPNVINFGKTVSMSYDSMTLAINSSLGIHIFCNRNTSKKQRGNTKYPYSGLWQETVTNIASLGPINAVGGVLADSIELSGNGSVLAFNDPSYIFSNPDNDFNTGSVRLFGTNVYSTITLQSGSMAYNVSATNNATVNTLDIPIALQAGNVLEFGSDGIPGASFTNDTYIRLIDSLGATVAENDQNGNSNGSYLNLVISNTGNYIMRIGGWDNEPDSGVVVWKVYSF